MAPEKVTIQSWEGIGPFPIGTREYPLIGSPLAAFTESLAVDPDIEFALRPANAADRWPSELCTGGTTSWSQFKEEADGWVDVKYPEVNWVQLRADHGWSSLQYQTILRSSLEVPVYESQETVVEIDAIQLAEYAFIPVPDPGESTHPGPVTWYQGDSYDFASTSSGGAKPGKLSRFARQILLAPGKYIVVARAVYDIRQFGDPGSDGVPTIKFKVNLQLARKLPQKTMAFRVRHSQIKFPGVFAGWLLGEWASLGINVAEGTSHVEVLGVESKVVFSKQSEQPRPPDTTLVLELPQNATILSGQTRDVALKITQRAPLPADANGITIDLKVKTAGSKVQSVSSTVTFSRPEIGEDGQATPGSEIWITFATPSVDPRFGPNMVPASVSEALVVVPSPAKQGDKASPVLLALHGAGVDLKNSAVGDAFAKARPQIPGLWSVLPTGKNEWGEDWHGSSMADAWSAREAAGATLRKAGVALSDETVLIGHSNGGQGAWHLAARYPDRVTGVVAASGWLTIQHYVPYSDYTSTHYADPSLMGILSSSLTPYNNDLYTSNLADIPILAVHGTEDDNVPPRHSRAHAALISSWAGTPTSSVSVAEVPREKHWWDDVLRNAKVVDFINGLPSKATWDEQRKGGYTLTTANPEETGGRAGIRIVELDVPGRLARLDVNARQWKLDGPSMPLDIRGMNIKRIEIRSSATTETYIKTVTGQFALLPSLISPLTPPRANGPMIRLLSSQARFSIIVPSLSGEHPRHLSVAKRIAHDLYVYHRIDCEILGHQRGLERAAKQEIGPGNVVVIGRPEENRYTEWMIAQKSIPLEFPTRGVMLIDKDRVVYDRGAGIIALHPHPTHPKSLSVLLAGNDELGLELAARLFPLRTGVPIPDWVLTGPRSKWQGAGGFIGAGFWDGEWQYSDAMSWMDR
ncbi:hypothetical protein L198_00585 [Cryptococcus wingfieldii CBS 7118]|uniref:Peptidase S9 prolyl oligopeptidase catalytic domain-containing protein n=1 Tax=Cryptococcus wingfieldii CBS 7118 TaxID=1295528 RepID=A0A1E3K708_9TREE|nr:hypothetical protein L198_00585 [Cryptococcus wingfieldii CBS 7118]ODO08851.1 hypothetical protein L198_00585 [Cryptococcus wingfieldii CBS 7118]